MNQSLQNYIEESDKLFEEKVPTRVLNEDNPQYVLGWNMAKELSKSFLHERQIGLVEIVKGCVPKEKKIDNLAGDYRNFVNEGFNSCREQIIKNLEK